MVSSSNFALNPFAGKINVINKNGTIYHNKRGRNASYARMFTKINHREENKWLAVGEEDKLLQLEMAANTHKVLKDLCIENDNRTPRPEGTKTTSHWTYMSKFEKINDNHGFRARVYKDKHKIAIIYSVQKELLSLEDAYDSLFRGKELPQFEDAKMIYDIVVKAFPSCQIYVSGHSTGGTLAQYIALNNEGVTCVTFNSVGLANFYTHKEKFEAVKNIYNYVTSKMPRFIRTSHIGETRMVYINEYTGIPNNGFGSLLSTNSIAAPKHERHELHDFDYLEYYTTNYSGAA